MRALVLAFLACFAGSASAQRLNEILYAPHPAQPPAVPNGDSNGDGFVGVFDDEFVEIYNHTAEAVDLSAWSLSDAVDVRHRFPAGTVLPSGCVVVVFGGGTPTGAFGDALVQTASSGAFMLENDGDSVLLHDADGHLVDSYTFGSEGNDESLTREIDGSNLEPLVPHTRAGGAVGVHSPGTRVDGTPFPGCAVAVSPGAWSQLKQIYR